MGPLARRTMAPRSRGAESSGRSTATRTTAARVAAPSAATSRVRRLRGDVLSVVLVALRRRGDVGEVRQERLVVRVHAVPDEVVRGAVGEPEPREERAVALRRRPQLD